MKKWWGCLVLACILSMLMIQSDQFFSQAMAEDQTAGPVVAKKTRPGPLGAEVGSDFRLSGMGPDLDPNYDAVTPAVAYNSNNNQFLVVWSGDDATDGEFEIWGQRVNAATGAQIGADFQISYMGTAGDIAIDANDPAVAYNSATNEYLVVWSGDRYIDGDFEIWAHRVNGATGVLVGSVVRVSVMGPGTDTGYDAESPAVVYNSVDNEYLVVWSGSHNEGGLISGEYEIWGRRLTASAEWAGDQFRISDMGGTGNSNYDARTPAVAYNSTDNQYLVVWSGDDNSGSLVSEEFEIFGQRLSSAGGGLGTNDFRISIVGDDGDALRDAFNPGVAYNSRSNEFLVVFECDPQINDAFDIGAQRISASGGLIGLNFFVSGEGEGPNTGYDATNPAVVYDRDRHEYLVVWQDDELGAGEFEIWGKRLNAANVNGIGREARLSDMGLDGNAAYDAQYPAVAYSGAPNYVFLVVWSGDDVTDGEFEIWSQRVVNPHKMFLPLILKGP